METQAISLGREDDLKCDFWTRDRRASGLKDVVLWVVVVVVVVVVAGVAGVTGVG